MRTKRLCGGLVAFVALVVVVALLEKRAPAQGDYRQHLSSMTWTKKRWGERKSGVRTSYNPDKDLTDETLTLVPGDPRWLDFVYWSIDNKVAEHQVEAYGGTGWDGPKGGIIFHWAPGSHWERDTLASFGFTIGHTIGEHRWTDTMFPDFFEKYGGVYGVNLKDRLAEIDPSSARPWVEFLEYSGGASSPYYRYLFHREAVVDPVARKIHFYAGQGVAFTYTFERYYHEVREVLTDARIVDFFEAYDRLGAGFAASGNWAHQNPSDETLARAGYSPAARPGQAEETRYDAFPEPVAVPDDLPEAEAMRRGEKVYLAQCAMCHGIRGDGKGFLAAGMDERPRDFTQGWYKLRTTKTGKLPSIEDVERTIKVGVPNGTMPAWGQFLTPEQIHDVARYLVAFSERFADDWREGKVPEKLAVSARPSDLASLASRGAAIWKEIQCFSCHGEHGWEGPGAIVLKDDWGHPMKLSSLTYKWSYKNGHEPEDVYRTIFGGLNGTPMPAFESSYRDEDDRWALVAYVLSLSPAERPVLRLADFAKDRAKRIGPDGHVRPKTEGSK